mmetsp:Transcript_115673/g.258514  ORF Transcript_115673/g.258514 Transcript_115673/m.258514 type:complete len:742 (+) Transcript_115673:139-2364(+)
METLFRRPQIEIDGPGAKTGLSSATALPSSQRSGERGNSGPSLAAPLAAQCWPRGLLTRYVESLSLGADQRFSSSTDDAALLQVGEAVNRAAEWIATCDALLVGTGSSPPAGAGEEEAERGNGNEVCKPRQFIDEPDVAWSLWARQHNSEARPAQLSNPGYLTVQDWADEVPLGSFAFTSDTDGLWEASGWDRDCLVEVHGSARWLQCSAPCCSDAWEAPSGLAASLEVDGTAQRARGRLPTCPRCGEAARPAVQMAPDDRAFSRRRRSAQAARFYGWIRDLEARPDARALRVVCLELECSASDPVVRRELELVLQRFPAGRLVRVSEEHPDFASEELGARGVSLPLKATDALERLQQEIRLWGKYFVHLRTVDQVREASSQTCDDRPAAPSAAPRGPSHWDDDGCSGVVRAAASGGSGPAGAGNGEEEGRHSGATGGGSGFGVLPPPAVGAVASGASHVLGPPPPTKRDGCSVDEDTASVSCVEKSDLVPRHERGWMEALGGCEGGGDRSGTGSSDGDGRADCGHQEEQAEAEHREEESINAFPPQSSSEDSFCDVLADCNSFSAQVQRSALFSPSPRRLPASTASTTAESEVLTADAFSATEARSEVSSEVCSASGDLPQKRSNNQKNHVKITVQHATEPGEITLDMPAVPKLLGIEHVADVKVVDVKAALLTRLGRHPSQDMHELKEVRLLMKSGNLLAEFRDDEKIRVRRGKKVIFASGADLTEAAAMPPPEEAEDM